MNYIEKQNYADNLIMGKKPDREKVKKALFENISPEEWLKVLDGDFSIFKQFDHTQWLIFATLINDFSTAYFAFHDYYNYKLAVQWIKDFIPQEYPDKNVPLTIANVKELGHQLIEDMENNHSSHWVVEQFAKENNEPKK